MVYCAGFGCNNQAKKGNGLSFFFHSRKTVISEKCGHLTASDGTSFPVPVTGCVLRISPRTVLRKTL